MYFENGQLLQMTGEGAQTPSAGMGMLAALPRSLPYMALNVDRVGNTMLRGPRNTAKIRGRLGRGKDVKDLGWVRAGFRNNNFTNAHFWRDRRMVTDDFLMNPKAKYSPLQMSKMGNWGAGKVARLGKGKESGKLASMWATREAGGEFFQGGGLGRINAAAKLQGMNQARYSDLFDASGQFKSQFMAKNARGLGGSVFPATGGQAAHSILMQMDGVVSGRVGGFIAGTTRQSGMSAVAGNKYAQAGYDRAVNWSLDVKGGLAAGKGRLSKEGGRYAGKRAALAGGKLALKAGSLTTPIGWALFAYDIAKAGARAAGYASRTVFQAADSATKGLRTPIGGRQFIETNASLTSRSRGVMAIQNSRLNARSVLGNEASSMAGYMG